MSLNSGYAVFSRKVSTVSICTSIYLHGCWDDRIRKDCLGQIFVAPVSKSNRPTTREDCLPRINGNNTNCWYSDIPSNLEHDSYFDIHKRNLMVIDDQMADAGEDKRIINLFTRGSHHRNLNVIYIVQNLFHQGKGSRSISSNSHYLVRFKNPQD